MFRNLFAFCAIAAATAAMAPLFVGSDASACIHPPVEVSYPLLPGTQLGLVFFDNGREELVIRPSYKLDLPETGPHKPKDDAHGKLTTLAWVIPVPVVPDSYKEADEAMFGKLRDFTAVVRDVDTNGLRSDAKGHKSLEDQRDGVELLEAVAVGDYKIQPIKAKGELGGLELKAWMKDNGFGEIKDETLKYYLGKDYCWLAVKMHNAKGLPADGNVKPLQIGFATDTPCYPLKINAGANSFDLELWLITRKEVDLEKSAKFGLKTAEQGDAGVSQSHRQTTFDELPELVRKSAQDVDGLKALKAGDLNCYRFFGKGMNKTTDLAKLEGDLKFEFKPEAPAPGKNK